MRCYVYQLVVWLTLAATLHGQAAFGASLLGPNPYLSFDDSPFKGVAFGNFFLEDLEDGVFNPPGVTGISNTPGTTLGVLFPNVFADSVDGDDGVIDGFGRDGHSLGDPDNLPTDDLGYTFVFDELELGRLPTHVGIVWTDGSQTASTQFEAFGPDGQSLGLLGPVKISDSSFAGTTAEDRFFGVINEAGVSSFTIRSPGGNGDLEVDHLQYGIVPIPPTAILLGSGLVGLAAFRHKRRKT